MLKMKRPENIIFVLCSLVAFCLTCNIWALQTLSAVHCCRNKDRATHPITSVKLSTSRQTCAFNINTSDPHYSSQEQSDSCYEIGWQCLWWMFASETAQRNLKLTQFADGVLSKAVDILSLCNSLTIWLCLCVSCVENKRTVLPKHSWSRGWVRECLCSYNRCTVLWLQGDVQRDEWNRLLTILDEFQYSACEMRWEVQLRGNFVYWAQQGDHKTGKHRGPHEHRFLCTHTHTHTTFFGSCQT